MTDRPDVRPPLQERSRVGWERILEVGHRLLEEGGYEALSIADVCKRAGVSPTTIYARVDGKAGLFDAVYVRGIEGVLETERRRFAAIDPGGDREARIAAVVGATVGIFEEHARFLRAVIRHSSSDPVLLARGSDASRLLLDHVVADLPDGSDPRAAEEVARTVYAECVVRLMYGPDFFDPASESAEEFVRRLTRTARARLQASTVSGPPL